MSRRRKHSVPKRRPRTRLVEVFGERYEVVQLTPKIRKIFRQELVLVEEQGTHNLIQAQMNWEDYEARRKAGLVKSDEPRPVKPHIPGRRS